MIDQKVLESIQALGKVIESNKAEKAKYEGGMEQIMNSLKQFFSVDDIDKAKALLQELQAKSLEKEAQVMSIYKQLTESIVW
jgi:hypothetical protein